MNDGHGMSNGTSNGMPMARVPMVPLRSVLFVASTEPAQISDALASGADAVILDMEEPQTPMNEAVRERARGIVRDVLAAAPPAGTPGAPRLLCRIQAPRTGQMLKDLRAVLHPSLHGVVVPKSLGPDDIVAADALVANAEVEAGLEPGRVVLYPILETAAALRCAYDIAMASPRVAHLGGAISRFGDIHQAVGYRWTPESRETFVLRSNVLIDARAAGIRYPISGMWGGAVADEVAYWRELVRLGDVAARTGVGPILFGDPGAGEGHVVHGAHVESARLNLEWATALGVA